MLTIGDYSRLTQVPAKTLRYYDEIDLFKPVQVDRLTGYRYYTVEQLPRLYRILSLKELGLTLDQIRNVLSESLSPEQLRGMLRLKEAQLKQTIEDEQTRLAYIEHKIQQLESESSLGHYDVILKNIPEILVALARDIAPYKSTLEGTLRTLFRTVLDFLAERKITPTGHGFTVYFDEEYRDRDIDVGAAFPIHAAVSGTNAVTVTTLAPETMASVIHKGTPEKMQNAYIALLTWIEKNGYQIEKASREIALQYDPTGSPEHYITEIQFPVRKRSS
jgi:DNA-binding transcriptional MerR regulator/predicted transcriptional regulator YdeE